MIPAPAGTPSRAPARRLLLAGLAAVTALTAVLAGPVAPSEAAVQRWSSNCRTAPAAAAGAIRLTQANLKNGMTAAAFQADVRAVTGGRPDFITYNEVPNRQDSALAPEGYDLWRTPNEDRTIGRYVAATPVAWRTDRWQAIAQGTTNISNRWGKTETQSGHLGVRYANWVTLRNLVDGRVLSVVSAHFAPKTRYTSDLLAPSIHALGKLTDRLSASGPVLVGGDLNVHYNSADYNNIARPLLRQYGLTPTYDVSGIPANGTGDYRSAVIDYVLMRQASSFGVQAHCTYELNSDHDAVTADLAPLWSTGNQPPVFVQSTLVNDPAGTSSARRAVLDLMIRAIDHAPAGAGIHLDSHVLADGLVFESLARAKRRGVHIQFLTRTYTPTDPELKLMRRLGSLIRTRQWAVECPAVCRRIDRRTELPPTRLLVSMSGNTPAVSIIADRPLSRAATRLPARASIFTDKPRYDAFFGRFLRLVGRRL